MDQRAKLKKDIHCDLSLEWLGRKGESIEVVGHNRFGVFNLTVRTQSGMLLNVKENEIERPRRIRYR